MMVATSLVVIVFFVGHRITPLLSPWSTMTNRESKPFEVGRSMMRSYDICLNGNVSLEMIRFRGGIVGWVLVLFCWQGTHPSTNFYFMNWAIPGHQCPAVMSCLVLRYPGWPAVWWSWNFLTRSSQRLS